MLKVQNFKKKLNKFSKFSFILDSESSYINILVSNVLLLFFFFM